MNFLRLLGLAAIIIQVTMPHIYIITSYYYILIYYYQPIAIYFSYSLYELLSNRSDGGTCHHLTKIENDIIPLSNVYLYSTCRLLKFP
jgi:hypothetical protein